MPTDLNRFQREWSLPAIIHGELSKIHPGLFDEGSRVTDIAGSGHCCEMMEYFAGKECDQHPNRFDCPDALIHRSPRGYGIIIHDGGESWVSIKFCPWCGVKLPEAAVSRDG